MVVKSNGNMYPDKDTWNPLGGECIHDCSYCYRRNWKVRSQNCARKYSGDIRLWKSEFKSLGKGNEIFVCSMTDLFSSDVPKEYILEIINHCKNYNNLYLFQTKNPSRVIEFIDDLPENTIIGTTIETNRDSNGYSKAPSQVDRGLEMAKIRNFIDKKGDINKQVMVSIEPIMDFDLEFFINIIKKINPDYVSIGADSKCNSLSEPSKKKTLALIRALKKVTHVKIKDNLVRITS